MGMSLKTGVAEGCRSVREVEGLVEDRLERFLLSLPRTASCVGAELRGEERERVTESASPRARSAREKG